MTYYGEWRDVSGYGYAWSPRVDAGWTPYSQGYWLNDYPYGPTWVSTEPWGYAPYHYGRWAFAGDRWYWVPDSTNATPRYSPALVAFVPFGDNEIGWVPLGPGDPYVYRYYDENWQPHYLTRGDVAAANLVNLAVPNAVTVVPLDAFGRPIDPRSVRHMNPSMITQVRPTLEPLLLTPLRNAALRSAWGRGKIDLPPGIAKKLQDTSVVLSHTTTAPPFKKDLDKSLRVERVSEKVKNQNFKVKDERNIDASQNDVGRKQEIDRLSKEAAQGNKESQRQVHQFEQQQRKDERQQQNIQRKAIPPAQGAPVGHPVKPNPVKPKERPPQPQIQSQPARGAAKQESKQPPGNAKPAGGGGKGKSKGKP